MMTLRSQASSLPEQIKHRPEWQPESQQLSSPPDRLPGQLQMGEPPGLLLQQRSLQLARRPRRQQPPKSLPKKTHPPRRPYKGANASARLPDQPK